MRYDVVRLYEFMSLAALQCRLIESQKKSRCLSSVSVLLPGAVTLLRARHETVARLKTALALPAVKSWR